MLQFQQITNRILEVCAAEEDGEEAGVVRREIGGRERDGGGRESERMRRLMRELENVRLGPGSVVYGGVVAGRGVRRMRRRRMVVGGEGSGGEGEGGGRRDASESGVERVERTADSGREGGVRRVWREVGDGEDDDGDEVEVVSRRVGYGRGF